VKFRWKPTCGVKFLLEDEAIKVGGSLRLHHGWKLPPSRKLFIQIMDLADEDKFDFDPIDVTKTLA
jgi:catalase